MSSLRRVTALIDWDTARRLIPHPGQVTLRHVEAIFERLQTAIANYINASDNKNFYRISWRIYHGWHRGKTKTVDRHVFENYLTAARSRTIRQVSFSTDFAFGDHLCCSSKRNPIFDTLRADPETREPRQKMVDAILICDLLHLARSRDSQLLIVIANDDDIIPGLFTAEAWKANVVMLHNRPYTNSHLNLFGIASRMVMQ